MMEVTDPKIRKKVLAALKRRDRSYEDRRKKGLPCLVDFPMYNNKTGKMVSLTKIVHVGATEYHVEVFVDDRPPYIRIGD